MLVLFSADIVKPQGMDDKEFYQIWHQEAQAAVAGLQSGMINNLWKAAGRYRVVGVFDFPDGDSMDAAFHSLPIWTLGHHEMVQNVELTPLRPYENWAEDLKKLSGAG